MLPCKKQARTRSRRGAAAVELAVLLPFLVFMMVIAVDWARVFYYTVTINDCARNGALYMYDSTGTTLSPFADYKQAALAGTDLSPTPTVSSNSGGGTNAEWVEVTVSYPFRTLTNFPGVPQNTTVTRTIRISKASKLPAS